MRRTKGRLTACAILLSANILFIWGNSLLPGQFSAAISHWLGGLLELIFGSATGEGTAGHGVLRKIAHVAEFAILGAGLSWLLGMLQKPLWGALIGGFLVACVDETIQCFVPERGPKITDVLIDTCGAGLGIGLLLLGYTIYKKSKTIGGNKQ